MTSNRRKILLTIAAVLLLGFIIFSIAKQTSYSAQLTIEVVPGDSRLVVNNKSHSPGIFKVKPGMYTIIVSRSGFATSSMTVQVNKKDNLYEGIALVSNSPLTANWYLTHTKDEQRAEALSSKNFDSTSAARAKRLPL